MRFMLVLLVSAFPAAASAALGTLSSTGFGYIDFQQIRQLAPAFSQNAPPERLTPRQKLTVQQITSIFESATTEFLYSYIEDIDDGGGVTCGRIGFTQEGIKDVVSRYSALKNGDTPLANYLPCLEQLAKSGNWLDYQCLYPSLSREDLKKPGFKTDGGLIARVDFGKAWTEAGDDSMMRQAQDQIEEAEVYDPALKDADELGLKTPLSIAYVYDAIVQLDEDALFRAIKNDFAAVHGGRLKPANIAEEAEWLRFYLKERRAQVPNSRIDSLEQLLDAGNFQLQLPLTFMYDGNRFTIDEGPN
jgi:chitosanase